MTFLYPLKNTRDRLKIISHVLTWKPCAFHVGSSGRRNHGENRVSRWQVEGREDYSVRKEGQVLRSTRWISLDIHIEPKAIWMVKNPRGRDTLKLEETLRVILPKLLPTFHPHSKMLSSWRRWHWEASAPRWLPRIVPIVVLCFVFV